MLLLQADISNSSVPQFLGMPVSDSWATIGVALFTLGLVIVNYFFVLLVYQQLKQTNEIIRDNKNQAELLKRQIELSQQDVANRLRPWIGVSFIGLAYQSPGNLAYENVEVYGKDYLCALLEIHLKNYGQLPASNFACSVKMAQEKIDVNLVPTDLDYPGLYLMPTQTSIQNCPVRDDMIADVGANRSKLYAVVRYLYFNEMNNNSSYAGFLFECKKYSDRYMFVSVDYVTKTWEGTTKQPPIQ